MSYRTSPHESSQVGWSVRILVLAGGLLLVSAVSFGQGGRASVNGTVTDQSGAVVAGAKVLVADAATGQSRQTTTADNGTQLLHRLPLCLRTNYCLTPSF